MLFRQPAAEPVGLFDQLDLVPRLGRFQRRRHAGDSAADDHDGLVDGLFRLERLQRLHLRDSCEIHAEIILRHHLRVLFAGRLAPDNMLTQGDPLDDHIVRKGVYRIPARRDPGDDHLGQAFAGDGLVDRFQAGTFAGFDGLAEGHLALTSGHFAQRINVERFSNSVTSANEDAGLVFHEVISPCSSTEPLSERQLSTLSSHGTHHTDVWHNRPRTLHRGAHRHE